MRTGDTRERREPHHTLEAVRGAFLDGRFVITLRVRRHMALHDWTERDVVDCIAKLSSSDFHKSQAHRIHGGVWLDIYRPTFAQERRYVKFTRELEGSRFVVLSFCVDGEDH
jgi:hypothetical protein